MRSKGYEVFKKPYELNIVGVRSKNTNPIKFDDSLYVFWKDDKFNWEGKEYAITTDPSTAYLTKEDKKGVAILPSGQYLNKFTVGKHKGEYRALVQSRPICVYRDFDRNPIINFNTKDLDFFFFNSFTLNPFSSKPFFTVSLINTLPKGSSFVISKTSFCHFFI